MSGVEMLITDPYYRKIINNDLAVFIKAYQEGELEGPGLAKILFGQMPYRRDLSDGVGIVLRLLDREDRAGILAAESRVDLANTVMKPESDRFKRCVNAYWGGKQKKYFGVNAECLLSKADLPERMVHEAIHSPVAIVMAEILRGRYDQILAKAGGSVLELNTGMGSMTAALVQVGLPLWRTIERNTHIANYCTHLAEDLNLPHRGVKIEVGDAEEIVDSDYIRKGGVKMIFMDPPWKGYVANGGIYDLSVLGDVGKRSLDRLAEMVPIVAVKLPGNFDYEAAREQANKMKASLDYTVINYKIGTRSMREVLAVFMREDIVGDELKNRCSEINI